VDGLIYVSLIHQILQVLLRTVKDIEINIPFYASGSVFLGSLPEYPVAVGIASIIHDPEFAFTG